MTKHKLTKEERAEAERLQKLHEKEMEDIKAKENPPDFDPMLAQVERLPNFARGQDGAGEHMRPVDGPGGAPPPSDAGEGEFGHTPADPSKLTAD